MFTLAVKTTRGEPEDSGRAARLVLSPEEKGGGRRDKNTVNISRVGRQSQQDEVTTAHWVREEPGLNLGRLTPISQTLFFKELF